MFGADPYFLQTLHRLAHDRLGVIASIAGFKMTHALDSVFQERILVYLVWIVLLRGLLKGNCLSRAETIGRLHL